MIAFHCHTLFESEKHHYSLVAELRERKVSELLVNLGCIFRVFFIATLYCPIQYRYRAGGTNFRKYVTENHKTMRRGPCAISVAWLKKKKTVMLSGTQTAAVCHGWCIRNTKTAALPLPCHSIPVSRLDTSEWSPWLSVPPRQV